MPASLAVSAALAIRFWETGRYRIASGMEAVWVILHEEAWNEGGAWKFIIDDITYTVE